MKERVADTIVESALDKHPGQKPRIISGNGTHLIAEDSKQGSRLAGITHGRTGPYYPQCDGKPEQWHCTRNDEHFRDKAFRNVDETRYVSWMTS